MKPGWKSSEFWLTLAAHVVSAVVSVFVGQHVGSETVQAVALGVSGAISTVAQGTYNLSRGNVKAAAQAAGEAAVKAGVAAALDAIVPRTSAPAAVDRGK